MPIVHTGFSTAEPSTDPRPRSLANNRGAGPVPVPSQVGQPLPSFEGTRHSVDPLSDPDFIRATPEQKHAYLTDITSPGYDPDYVQAPPPLQQEYLKSISPSTIMGMESLPERTEDGGVRQQTAIDRAVNPWAEPLAKLLLTALSAHGAGKAAGALTKSLPTLVPTLGRALGAGTATGAMTEGTLGEKIGEGAKGAGWSLGAEGLLRAAAGAGNTLLGSGAGKRFLEGARPPAPAPATPPGNPVTSATVMSDLGSQNPNPAFQPKALFGPQGQTVRTIHPQVSMDEMARAGAPVPLSPAKDLLVTRTPTAGTPAVPESYLERILRSGAPAAVSQEPNVQDIGVTLPGIKLLQGILSKFGLGGDDQLKGVGRGIGRGG